jgi:hypothetical protein
LPAWFTITEQAVVPLVILYVAVPLPLSTTLQPLVAPVVNAGINPELAVAATVKLVPKIALTGGFVVNVIVWLAGLTVWLTEPDAPLWFASPANVAVTVSLPPLLPGRIAVVHVAVAG